MTPQPRWQPVAAARAQMSAAWWRWVASRDSLTERLIQAAGERDFQVRLITQRLGQAHLDEAIALGLSPDRRVWLREVALCVDDVPWVMARSVTADVPRRSTPFDGLGERSLGSWLFRQPDLQRGPIEVCHAPRPIDHTTGPWQRRSVFRHADIEVLVQETFLDQMADALRLSVPR